MTNEGLDGRQRTSIDDEVVRALERRPKVAFPDGFAARVARSMPAKTTFRAGMRPVFGRAAGYLAAVVTTSVLIVLGWSHPEALVAGRGFLFAMEMLLAMQLLAVGWWLGMENGDAE